MTPTRVITALKESQQRKATSWCGSSTANQAILSSTTIHAKLRKPTSKSWVTTIPNGTDTETLTSVLQSSMKRPTRSWMNPLAPIASGSNGMMTALPIDMPGESTWHLDM